MATSKELAAALRDGMQADIWYDASEYNDTDAERRIEAFQRDIEKAAKVLDIYDELVAERDSLRKTLELVHQRLGSMATNLAEAKKDQG